MSGKLGILLSGSGSTYANLYEHLQSGALPAAIGVVIASRPDAYGLTRAQDFGHPHAVARDSATINQLLAEYDCDWVAMCGFMRRFDPAPAWQDRVLNVHPSLLPAFGGKGFYGDHVHRAVLASGAKVSGCSVHLVAGDYDSGPLLAQRTVPVHAEDTVASLRQRVQAAERHLYPLVWQAVLRDGIHGQGQRRWLGPGIGGADADYGFNGASTVMDARE